VVETTVGRAGTRDELPLDGNGRGNDASVKPTIAGGGGFRVPLVYGALLGDRAEGRVTRLVPYDLDTGRLSAVTRVLAGQAAGMPDAPEVTPLKAFAPHPLVDGCTAVHPGLGHLK